MKRMAQYITANTMQNVEGCWGLVVCPDRLTSASLAEKLVETGWNIHKQHMTAKKDGHASLRIMQGTNPEEVWMRMCGMQLNHIFTIGKSRSVALTVIAKLRSRQGVVDKGVHYLGEWVINFSMVKDEQGSLSNQYSRNFGTSWSTTQALQQVYELEYDEYVPDFVYDMSFEEADKWAEAELLKKGVVVVFEMEEN